MDEVLNKLFPSQVIPPEINTRLASLRFTPRELMAAHPEKLAPPLSYPEIGRVISKLQVHYQYSKPLRVNVSPETDPIISLALFLKIFKKFRNFLYLSSEEQPENKASLPVLDLSCPAGLRYKESGAGTENTPGLLIPRAADGGPPYSRAGLVFKLGQAWQLFRENDFNQEYVAFDLETTGMSPRNSEIIEIAGVKIKNGKLGDEFNSFVRPTRAIPRKVSSLTGITYEDVKNAPLLEEILPSFLNFIGDAVLIAHNIDFDFDFLRYRAKKLLGFRLTNKTFDTLAQARGRMPGISHRLKSVTENLGIELKDWHRAGADARAAALIFLSFREKDSSPRRYAYFENWVPWAGLGTIAARVPLEGDNAVFFRYGLPSLLSAFRAGEKYFKKHPERKNTVNRNLLDFLISRRRKKQFLGIHQIIEQMETR